MKKTRFLLCWLLFLALGCSQKEKDQGIKELLASRAKGEAAFTAVSYTVKDGVLTLSGNTPTEEEKHTIEEKVKEVSGVKEVVNN